MARTYLHFNTAPIQGKVIQWGRLDIAESHSYNCGAGGPTPYRVVQGWNGWEMTAWPGAAIDIPAGGALNPAGGSCPNRLYSADMNGASVNWASGAWNNLGIALVAPNETDNNYWKKFKSLETGAPPALHVGWTEPAAAPSPPQNVIATSANASASVTWSPPASNGGAAVDNYIVYAYNSPSGAYANTYALVCGTCTSATITGLTNGQPYYFVAYAHNAVNWGGGSAASNVVTPAVQQPPGPPQNASATPRNLSAIVNWTPPANNGGAAIDYYGIFAYSYPSYTLLSYTQGCATCTSVTVPNLTNGQQYYFAVYSHNAVNWGGGVGTNVVTPAVTTPSAPVTVIASPGNASAAVAWSASTDNGGAAINAYYVFRYSYPGLAYLGYTAACATCTSATVGGLTNGSAYQFLVFASNSVGNGTYTWSNVVTAGASPALLAPTGVVATRGDHQATVTWTRPGLRIEGVTTYVIKVFTEANPTAVAASATVTDPASTAVVTGLTNGQSSFATVTASTLVVINAESARSAVFVSAGPPLAPTGVVALRSDTKATVTWATVDANGAPITGYEIAIVNPSTQTVLGVRSVIGSGSEVTGLTNGTPYAFKVRATNAVGTGNYSVLSGPITTAERPFPPADVTGTPGNGQAVVAWSPPSARPDGTPGDNGEPITSYVVSIAPGSHSVTVNGTTTSTTVTGLSNGTVYSVTVAAVNAFGASDPTYADAVIIPAAPPTTPSNVVASPGDGYAFLRWGAASDPGVPVTYTIRATPGGATKSTMSLSAVLDGLTNGQEYTFTVQATNSAGTSGVSLPSNPATPRSFTMPLPSPQCQVSTLPPPPGEVLQVNGEVRRRINVPCMPLLGRVRVGFYIADDEVHVVPGAGVIADGDGRGPDPGIGPEDNRIYIEVDYSTGTGFVEVNDSCADMTMNDCTPANTLVGSFDAFTRGDGTVSIHFSIGNSQAVDVPIFRNLEITGDLEIIPMPDGDMCISGTASRFPSIDAYYDQGSQTDDLLDEPQSNLGSFIALALPDRGIHGCKN